MNRLKNVSCWMKQMMLPEFYFKKKWFAIQKWEKSHYQIVQYPTYHINVIASYHGASGYTQPYCICYVYLVKRSHHWLLVTHETLTPLSSLVFV